MKRSASVAVEEGQGQAKATSGMAHKQHLLQTCNKPACSFFTFASHGFSSASSCPYPAAADYSRHINRGSLEPSPGNWTGGYLLKENGIRISMDGKGCWRDNVFVERLWRTIQYEEVYLKAYDSVSAAKASLGAYLAFYNTDRPHQSLDGQTPDTIYFANLPQKRFVA